MKLDAIIADQLASLRAKSHILSQREDLWLLQIQNAIRARALIDDEIDRIEKELRS